MNEPSQVMSCKYWLWEDKWKFMTFINKEWSYLLILKMTANFEKGWDVSF